MEGKSQMAGSTFDLIGCLQYCDILSTKCTTENLFSCGSRLVRTRGRLLLCHPSVNISIPHDLLGDSKWATLTIKGMGHLADVNGHIMSCLQHKMKFYILQFCSRVIVYLPLLLHSLFCQEFAFLF